MAYSRLNKKDGDKMYGSDVTHIEDGIVQNESDIKSNTDLIDSLDILTNPGTSIPSNSDLNDYSTPGKYYTTNSSVNNTVANVPRTGAGGTFFVIATQASERRCQIAIYPTGSGFIYYRIYSDTTNWTDWKEA